MARDANGPCLECREMTTLADLTIHVASLVCTPEVVRRVVEPAIADVEHERWDHVTRGERHRAMWVAVRGYIKVVGVITIALPHDVIMHRRPASADVLRLVTGIALGGVSPSCGNGPLLRLLSRRSADSSRR